MNKWLRLGLFGFFVWVIPFLFRFAFYNKEGNLIINVFLFKSIMLIIGALTGASFMVIYFKKLKRNFLKTGIRIGIVWFAINILLDLIVYVPVSHMDIFTYLAQIGLRYIIIPVMSVSMGIVAQNA